jgi:hypothetical protein
MQPQQHKHRLSQTRDVIEVALQAIRNEKPLNYSVLEHRLQVELRKHEELKAIGFKEFILWLEKHNRFQYVALRYMADKSHPPEEYKNRVANALSIFERQQPEKLEAEDLKKAFWKNAAEEIGLMDE